MTDILGRPAKVGDRILTKDYYSPNLNYQTTITKVNKVTIRINVKASRYAHEFDLSLGKKIGSWTYGDYSIKRRSADFVIINEQLDHNLATYPEVYI